MSTRVLLALAGGVLIAIGAVLVLADLAVTVGGVLAGIGVLVVIVNVRGAGGV